MPPQRGAHPTQPQPTANPRTVYGLSLLSEYTHTLDTLPIDLSRNFAALREIDAVISTSMQSITGKIYDLIRMIEQNTVPKEERLWLLAEIADEANRLKYGGEDKIRFACQAADSLKGHSNHLRALSERIPDFDVALLNRKTTYPHVAPRSFMPVSTTETGRRRRGNYGSLLSTIPDQPGASGSGAGGSGTTAHKRKRVVREEEVDIVVPRSPKKDRVAETTSRARNGGRAKKNERAVSPAESMQSITSHVPQPHPNGVSTTSGGANNNTSRGGPSNGAQSRSGNATNGISTTTSKRSRTNANNRAASPVQDQYYGHNGNGIVDHSHSGMTNGTGATHNGTHQHANGVNGHRVAGIPNGNVTNGRTGRNGGDTFGNVPPSSASAQHPSLPQPYPIGTTQHNMLEGPGMPVSRSATNGAANNVTTPPPQQQQSQNAPLSAGGTDGGATEAGDNDAEGDDRTYCICDGVSYGEMIACDENSCEREWFHLACIGLTVPPDGRWFCDSCRTKRSRRSGRGGKRRNAGGRANGKGS